MSDKSHTPTGVFVRLLLSDNEKMALTSGVKMGGSIEQGLLAIGNPVASTAIPVVTTLGTLRDPVPCVRQSDHQAALAAAQAEIGRDSERLDWLATQFKTTTVYMSGDALYAPSRLLYGLKGQCLREAIDAAREVG